MPVTAPPWNTARHLMNMRPFAPLSTLPPHGRRKAAQVLQAIIDFACDPSLLMASLPPSPNASAPLLPPVEPDVRTILYFHDPAFHPDLQLPAIAA